MKKFLKSKVFIVSLLVAAPLVGWLIWKKRQGNTATATAAQDGSEDTTVKTEDDTLPSNVTISTGTGTNSGSSGSSTDDREDTTQAPPAKTSQELFLAAASEVGNVNYTARAKRVLTWLQKNNIPQALINQWVTAHPDGTLPTNQQLMRVKRTGQWDRPAATT